MLGLDKADAPGNSATTLSVSRQKSIRGALQAFQAGATAGFCLYTFDDSDCRKVGGLEGYYEWLDVHVGRDWDLRFAASLTYKVHQYQRLKP